MATSALTDVDTATATATLLDWRTAPGAITVLGVRNPPQQLLDQVPHHDRITT